jgi:endosialidase-like protein
MKTTGPSILILFSLLCVGLLPKARAVMPPPDGDYPGGNTAEGLSALFSLTTGTYNTAIGFFSLDNNMIGSFNTAVGAGALFANKGDQNTATGAAALLNNTTGTLNTANGEAALFFNTTGISNTAVGSSALLNNTTASGGTAVGDNALINNTTGDNNMAIGFNALQDNTEGSQNSAIGVGALLRSTGNGNIGVGAGAGTLLTAGNNNIYVGNLGVATEDNTIRIGHPQIHTATFVAGINGADEGSPTAVFINTTTGQLGTTPPASSRRFKTHIQPMDQTSEAILALKPVTFEYKSDTKGTPQFGLIAEEVAKINPALVLPDKEGKPYTVRYEAVNAMLLNEFLKARRQIDAQQKQIDALTAAVQKVGAQLAAARPSDGGGEVNKSPTHVAENNQ